MARDEPPYQDEFEERDDQEQPTGYFSRSWLNFFTALRVGVGSAARQLKRVPVSGSVVAGATPFSLGTLAAGLYRVSWNGRVKTPAGVSSSFRIHLGYTDGGVALVVDGANVNGNLSSSKDLGDALLRIDNGSPITYTIDYASNPAAAMVYAIDFVIESLNL